MAERLVQPDTFELHPCHKIRYKFAKSFIRPTSEVMDYGCGIGYGTWMLAPYCEHITGYDKSQDAIDYGNKYYIRENMKIFVRDHPPEDMKFDVITAFEVIEHVEDSLDILKRLASCLKDDGQIVCSVPNELAIHFTKEDPRCEFHFRHFTPETLENLIKDAGLKINIRCQQMTKQFPNIMADWGNGYTLIGVLSK
jgi:2-polyprenyl-3-methyl-5-hydroxy-6-metoxy-1,4-benzoquinol methylase